MKTIISILSILVMLSGCNNRMKMVTITPEISITLPKNFSVIEQNPSGSLIYEARLDSDLIKIATVPFTEPKTASPDSLREFFRKNVDMFMDTFNHDETDSSYLFKGNLMQCNLNFDFEKQGRHCWYSGQIMALKQKFVIISYYSINPAASEQRKDMILSSVRVKI
ncbi:MAG TPA: hypothetical protein VHO68_02340 [Bacteroidales bacterium]|nr:hypothetical protein [Bacteroidales bacterium]